MASLYVSVTVPTWPLDVCRFCQNEAEEALQLALPALEAARLALDDLDKNDVTEIRYANQRRPDQ